MPYVTPGPTSVYIPTLELSGNLVVGFSRNRSKYALNNWTRWRNVKVPQGLWRQINPLDYNRVKSGSSTEFDWAPGNLRPQGLNNNLRFQELPFNAKRKSYGCTFDLITVKNADYDVMKSTTENCANQAMVVRTLDAIALATNSANHIASHVATATVASGAGFLSAGTETDPRIKKALAYISLRINRDASASVNPGDIAVVMNPNTAQLLANTQEIHSIFVRSQYANAVLTAAGGADKLAVTPNGAKWGLPDMLYGHPVIVDDTTANLFARDDATAPEAQAFVFPDNLLLLVTVIGDVENKGLSPAVTNQTSLSFFLVDGYDMSVKTNTLEFHEIVEAAVTDYYDVQFTTNVTAGLITNVFS